MATKPIPPHVPQLSLPVPQRNDPANFRQRADTLMTELPPVVDGINEAIAYVNEAKMDVSSMEAVRDAAYQARDDTQALKTAAEQSLEQIGNQKVSAIDQLTLDRINDMDLLTDQKIAVMELIRDAAQSSATSAAASAAAAGQAAGYPEFLAGTEGKPLTRMRDGSGVHFSEEFTPVILTSANRTLEAGDRVAVNTSTRTVTVTLPAEPFVGATVFLLDYAGTWDINNVTVNRNGRMIMGLNENMQLDLRHASISLVFTDLKGWILL